MVCRGALCKPVWHRVFLLPDPSAVAVALLQSRNCLELKSAAQRGLAVTEAAAESTEGEWFCSAAQPCCSRPQEVLNHSDHQPVLFLSNLVEGTYTFHLQVTDAKGESNTDRTTVEVKPGESLCDGPEWHCWVSQARPRS